MTKARIVYAAVMGLTAILFFWSARLYVLGILAVMILIPLLLRLLLQFECDQLEIDAELPKACQVGQNLTIRLTVGGRFFFSAGTVNLTMELNNKLLGQKRELPVTVGLGKKKVSLYLPYLPAGCGQVTVRLRSICCYDMMGLNCAHCPDSVVAVLTVYPEEVPLSVQADSYLTGFQEGEQQTVSKKGNDPSEVFDLREYQNGDDVRSIHWKLSEKMDRLLVKESSDTSHYSTIVLLDAGRFCGMDNCSIPLLSAAVGLALTFSERLLELGILHYTGIPASGGFLFEQVTERSEHTRVTDIWMGLTLEEQTGDGLRYFLADRIYQNCRHMIYITAGAFPDDIYRLPSDLHATAICLMERGGEVRATRKGLGVFLEIPLGRLNEGVHNIVI